MSKRRNFIKSVSLLTGITLATPDLFSKSFIPSVTPRIACQQYTWYSYFLREGKNWMEDVNDSFNAFLKSGLNGYEPSFTNPDEVNPLHQSMAKHNIWSKSMYVNSTLHEPELVEQSIAEVLAIAKEAKQIGIEILVTNPMPIRWGGPENKTDEQLHTQALALNVLGKELKSLGLTLAYHNHDAEMRESAREFHHMMTGTEPENVKLCLDAHWIYRGSGNSQVALFDIVELYNERIVELHLRQSHNGVWSEIFGEGDIDYLKLAGILNKKGIKPNIVLEQAAEEGTPYTINAIEAINKSLVNVEKVFDQT